MIDVKEQKYLCHSCNKKFAPDQIKNKPSLFYANFCKDCGTRCNFCQISLKILGYTKETVLQHALEQYKPKETF